MEQINKDIIILQIAMTKQILEIKEMLRSLIKQKEEEGKTKAVRDKFWEEIGKSI